MAQTQNLQFYRRALVGDLRAHPFSAALCILGIGSFLLVNQGGSLPEWALKRFAFSGDSPLWEWSYRSVLSDFLFFDLVHFLSSLFFFFFLFRWMEKSYPLKFIGALLAFTIPLDDIVNQMMLVAPYSYFHPKLFTNLVSIKDVGPSLWVALSLGIQLCTLNKHREVLYAVISIVFILLFAFSAAHYSALVINLNHSLFFAMGFIAGKVYFEINKVPGTQQRRRSTD